MFKEIPRADISMNSQIYFCDGMSVFVHMFE